MSPIVTYAGRVRRRVLRSNARSHSLTIPDTLGSDARRTSLSNFSTEDNAAEAVHGKPTRAERKPPAFAASTIRG